jgi:hypothetical protein
MWNGEKKGNNRKKRESDNKLINDREENNKRRNVGETETSWCNNSLTLEVQSFHRRSISKN